MEKTDCSLLPNMEIVKDGEPFEAHNFLALRGSLMGILHEIGHVNDQAQLVEEERTRERTLRARLVDKQKFSVPIEELSDTDLQDFVKGVYRAERGAWAHAFKRYRQIKKRDWN